jgi:hypothetical protein
MTNTVSTQHVYSEHNKINMITIAKMMLYIMTLGVKTHSIMSLSMTTSSINIIL